MIRYLIVLTEYTRVMLVIDDDIAVLCRYIKKLSLYSIITCQTPYSFFLFLNNDQLIKVQLYYFRNLNQLAA